ncbi:MAG: LysM peptidoglycan-binding domain-containing protein [Bdellovibrionota bacterium]
MRKLLILPVFIIISACAHKQPAPVSAGITTNAAGEKEVQDNLPSFKVSDLSGPEQSDEELDSIPVEVNPLVDKWIGYFKGRGRPHMERYLARSTRYEKLMKKVLRDNGLPEDLFYIALIESGFTSHATSHASAVGYWQFIRGTGSRYGLDINKFIDDRRDPVLATQAASDYFKGLYSVFGSWYLAMASYNAGENRIKRVVMTNATRDFWELAKKKLLPEETINYVPKFIAAKLIAKNPDKYGFGDIDYLPPVEFDTIVVNYPVNLRQMSDKMDYNWEDFKALNPKFKGEVAAVQAGGLHIRIPPGTQEKAMQVAAEAKVERLVYVADQGDTQTYRVRRGDNLSTIARKFRTTVAYLRDINDMSRGKKLSVGAKLIVPDRTPLRERAGRAKTAKVSKDSDSQASRSETENDGPVSGDRFHVVQSGESLFSIAKKYKTTVLALQKTNNIQRGKSIRAGMKLKLPSSDGDKKSMNSSSQYKGKMMKAILKKNANYKKSQKRSVASRKIVKK